MTYIFIIFLPLLSGLFSLIFGKFFSDTFNKLVAVFLLGLSCFLSWLSFYIISINEFELIIPIFSWLKVGSLESFWALKVDVISIIMMVVTTSLAFFSHIYSIGFLGKTYAMNKIIPSLNFLTFSVLVFVVSDDMLQLFFGWSGISFFSYLLVNYWNEQPAVVLSSVKSFIINRISDFGIIVLIILFYFNFNTISISEILKSLDMVKEVKFSLFFYQEIDFLECISLILIFSVLCKATQIVWFSNSIKSPICVLPFIYLIAMEGVGLFLIVRFAPLFDVTYLSKNLLFFLGFSLAFFSSIIALIQNNIKKIIAYSSCSQLGYMLVIFSMSYYNLSIFHFFIHSFSSSLLFWGIGAVIYGMSGEKDIRNMGRLWKYIPIVYVIMWVGFYSLAGFPFSSGFYSKRAIFETALQNMSSLYILILAIEFFTTLYAWRLLFIVFHGKEHAHEEVIGHIKGPDIFMIFPLFILSICSIFMGNLFFKPSLWKDIIFVDTFFKNHIILLIQIFAVLGVFTAFFFHLIKKENVLENILKSACAYCSCFSKLESFKNNFVFYRCNKILIKVKRINLTYSFSRKFTVFILAISNKLNRIHVSYINNYILAVMLGTICLIILCLFGAIK